MRSITFPTGSLSQPVLTVWVSLSILCGLCLLVSGCGSHKPDRQEAKTDDVQPLVKHWEKSIPHQRPPEGLRSLSAEECGECHQEIYKEWKESFHAQAWHDSQFQAEWAKDDSIWVCLNCHTPLQNQQEFVVLGKRDGDYFQPVKQPNPKFDPAQEEYLQVFKEATRSASFASLDQQASATGDERQTSLLKSARQRLLLWGITEKQIREIENTAAPEMILTFYSPITGYEVEKSALEGRRINQGADLYTIVDLTTVWVHADIYEYELPFIKVGQTAGISLSYDPDVNYVGKVDYIYPTFESQTRMAKIRLVFPNPELKLKPEMYANVEIAVDQGAQLTIPETAVLNTGGRQLIFVDKGNGRFEPPEIKLGTKVDSYYVVLEGLEEGEIIVKSGNFLIDAEAHVQGVLQTM